MEAETYFDGYSVGFVIGALTAGCRSIASSWPVNAPDDHRQKVVDLASAAGLVAKFKIGSVSVGEPETKAAPMFSVVPKEGE